MAERPLIGQGLFLANGRAANYQRVRTSQAMDTLMEYACQSISSAIPRVRGKPDHIISQGKEAVFATHDIYIQLNTVFTCVSIKYYVNYLSITLRFCIPMGNSHPGLAVSYCIYVVVNNHISKLQLFRTCIYMMNKFIYIYIASRQYATRMENKAGIRIRK